MNYNSQILFLIFVCCSSFISLIYGQCAKVNVRKEIRDLSTDELQRFINAILELGRSSQPNQMTRLDQLTQTHYINSRYAHGVPAFFPWHRYFVWQFEGILQQIDPSVTVPYWDWSIDSQAPEKSVVFRSNYFGGNSPGPNQCIATGPFANLTCQIPTRHCLSRSFSSGDRIGAFSSPEIISMLISQSQNYDALRRAIEGTPHSAPHLNIGGDMKFMYSPNDPIFWMHHAYIDKIWNDFQSAHPTLKFQYMSLTNPNVNSNDTMLPFNVPVSQVMDINTLCYTYAEPSFRQSQMSDMSAGNGISNGGINMISISASSPQYNIPDPLKDQNVTKALSLLLNCQNVKEAMSTARANQYLPNVTFGALLNRNPGPLDRGSVSKLRIPERIDGDWIHMMEMDLDYIRSLEDIVAAIYDTLNRMNNYTSMAAPAVMRTFTDFKMNSISYES